MQHIENYCFADIAVRIAHRHEYLANQCKDYQTSCAPSVSFEITESDIRRERERSEISNVSDDYLESLACYRKFCEYAVQERVLLFHSSAVAVDGVAYLFAAPSGTGKSPHTRLWRQMLGERAVMINDDKPLLRFFENEIRVYGTPWDGKHHLSTPISAPVGGVCLLSRGVENKIVPITANEALAFLLSQTFRPEQQEGMSQALQLVIELAARVPLWSLACNISEEAAQISYHTMRKETKL